MTPSKAKEVLYGLLYDRIKTAPLNHRKDPNFTLMDALRLLEGDEHEWVHKNILHECYAKALKKWETKHPKGWDNDNQRAYRAGKEGYPK